MNTFPFDVNKAAQAIGVLHSTEHASDVSYYRLLKLLYIADRESLKETGRPIVGGNSVAMDKGPLNSPVYNLIKGEHQDAPHWQQFFNKNGRYLTMKANPGTDELSAKEIRKLHEISERLGERDDEELHAMVQGFPEYRQHHHEGTSTVIPLDSELDALGIGDKKEAIHADIERVAAWKQLFGG